MIKATINGKPVEVKEGTSILEAAREANVKIPTLCHHEDLEATGGCGLCIVKVEGSNKMLRACTTAITEGMKIITHDPELIAVRKSVLELIMSNHPKDCLTCAKNQQCELQNLCAEFGIRENRYPNILNIRPHYKDNSAKGICIDTAKCIQCGRCVQVCQKVQNVWALSFQHRGIKTTLRPAGVDLKDSPCVNCGQCAAHCPVGAIVAQDDTQKVWDALRDPNKHCVVQFAPAVRVAIGEAFGYPVGKNLTGELTAALYELGFNTVLDTNFGADLTIMEEASEFKHRLTNNGVLPLITSCCPAWVDFLEKYHTDMLDNFSSAKSPHEMVGVLAKTYYAKQHNLDPKDVFVVSVMPCTAKKFEIGRSKEMSSSGYPDVDVSLTTREIARMIKQAGIEFNKLTPRKGDHILAEYTGAGTIFGATGGVMEAALRTAYFLVTGENAKDIDFKKVRGLKGIKEAKIDVKGTEVRVAVAHGLGNVEKLMQIVKKAKAEGKEIPYHFIEVMACTGGCVAGGGQPFGVTNELRAARAKGLYSEDSHMKLRCSHDNPAVKQLYKEFLGEPLHGKAHELLHTHYTARKKYQK